MKTKFDIIEKKKIDSDGDTYSSFYLKQIYFGVIPLYKWSFEEIMDNINGFVTSFLLLIFNITFYIVNNGESLNMLSYCFLTSFISVYVVYRLGREKYNSLSRAEDAIKKIIKKQSFKIVTKKVSSYEIDMKNGIIQKELNRDN